jgi:hypothetical protein
MHERASAAHASTTTLGAEEMKRVAAERENENENEMTRSGLKR